MSALCIVGASRRASGHCEIRLRHYRLASRRVLKGTVGHGESGAAGHTDKNRLFKFTKRFALLRRNVTHGTGRNGCPGAYTVSSALPERIHQRALEKIGWTLNHFCIANSAAMTGRHGAKALVVRGTIAASSGQWRRMTLVIPLFAIQSIPSGE